MAEWWDGKPDERYWCEITKREDIGANLRCPQLNTSGDPYWSYSLIHHVRPGDIVFHYSKKAQGVIGASVAGGPIEERDIIWSAQGTSGRAKRHQSPRKRSSPRPGWWLPLFGYKQTQKHFYELSFRTSESGSGYLNGLFRRPRTRGSRRRSICTARSVTNRRCAHNRAIW